MDATSFSHTDLQKSDSEDESNLNDDKYDEALASKSGVQVVVADVGLLLSPILLCRGYYW